MVAPCEPCPTTVANDSDIAERSKAERAAGRVFHIASIEGTRRQAYGGTSIWRHCPGPWRRLRSRPSCCIGGTMFGVKSRIKGCKGRARRGLRCRHVLVLAAGLVAGQLAIAPAMADFDSDNRDCFAREYGGQKRVDAC